MAKADSRPNILFFFSDQQRWDTCGCYGQKLPITPNLDRMAERGVRFANAYTCQPVCGPARAALQTGRFPAQIGCQTNHRRLPMDAKTVAHCLGDIGYETAYVGKWHLASCGERDSEDDFRERPVPPARRGGYRDWWVASDVLEFTSHSYDGHMFDADGNKVEMDGATYRADFVTDQVLRFLDTRSGEAPWYCMVSYIEPHHQNDHNCYEGPKGSKERWADYEVPGDLEETEGDWRENYPDYLGCCHSLDANLGRIFDRLETMGVADNTLVIYTSDHGSHFRTRNSEYKRSCHDGCTHIPMVLSGPGFAGGKTADALASLLDVPSTILRAAGCEPMPTLQGRALQDAADGAPADWRDAVYIQISESQCGRALRTPRWTYAVDDPDRTRHDPWGTRYVESYLYDNDADPHQRNNLVASPGHEAIRAELRGLLLRRIVEAGEPEPAIVPAPSA